MSQGLRSIAEDLGLSTSTVSRVVNNHPSVSPDTRKRVLEYLGNTDYTPNDIARSLRNQATNTVGIIIPDITENFFTQVIKSADAVLRRSGYSLVFSDSNEAPRLEEKYLDFMFQKRVDALVLATVAPTGTALRKFLKHDIPVVFIDNLPKLSDPFDAVILDNLQASAIAVDHLVKQGHTRIGLIAGNPQETTGAERLEGYARALSRHRIPFDPDLVRYGNYKDESGVVAMNELIANRRESALTAVYVTSEKMTFGAIAAVRGAGLMIPDDISIISFDFHDRSGLIVPGISTIIQPEAEIGRTAAALVVRRIKEKATDAASDRSVLLMAPTLQVRESVRAL